MKKEELLEKTKRKIDEINIKIKGLKDKILPGTGEEIKEKMKAAIEELEKLQEKVRSQYDELVEIDRQSDEDVDRIEKKRDEDVAEIEKNVFTSIRSFDESFRKAGRIFKGRRNI